MVRYGCRRGGGVCGLPGQGEMWALGWGMEVLLEGVEIMLLRIKLARVVHGGGVELWILGKLRMLMLLLLLLV